MKVTIAGGGLVGSLCACALGQRGHDVSVYEYRPDPRSLDGALVRGRSINLALSVRGRTTLSRVGLEQFVLENAIPMKGRMLHGKDGSKTEFLYDPNGNQCIYSISRKHLNDELLTEAEKLPNVKVHFDHKLLHVDVNTGTTKFKIYSGKESEVEISSDFVIGADGAYSSVRQSILKKPLVNFSQTYIPHGYMELCILPLENGKHAMEKNYLHIWPRDQFMLIALPNLDGSFTVTLFMPFEIFNMLNTAEQVESFFAEQFPDALQLIGKEPLCQDFLSSRALPLVSVKVKPLNAGRAVLLGDAAHAMVPFYGQGMNAGFEDVLILDDLLEEESSSHIETVLSKYTALRSEDAQAICDLAMYNYVEMRHLVNQKAFHFRRFIDVVLNKLMGGKWVPLYNNVTFSRTPYSKCIKHKEWQDEIMKKLKQGMKYISLTFAVALMLKNKESILSRVDQFKLMRGDVFLWKQL